MKIQKIFFLPLLVLLLTACGPAYWITSDYEKSVDFSSYQTYKILEHRKDFQTGINPINKQRIERALNREMVSLDYRLSDTPDLLVAYFVKIERVKEVDVYGTYYRQWHFPYAFNIDTYEEGTLVVDLIDRQKRQVVWHGTASGRVYRDMDRVEEKINKVVKDMMETYAAEAGIGKSVAGL